MEKIKKDKYIHLNIESIMFYKDSERYGFGIGVGYDGTIVTTYFYGFDGNGYFDGTTIKRFYI